MKRYPLLMYVLLFPYLLSAQAQPIEKIKLSPPTIYEEIHLLTDKTVSKIEVVIDLKDTTKLGYAIKNDEETEVLQPDMPWQIWLNSFIHASFSPQLTPGTTGRILLIVKDIRVQKGPQYKTALRFKGEVWKAQELADAYNYTFQIDTIVIGNQEVSDQLAPLLVFLMNQNTDLVKKEFVSIPRAQAIGSTIETTPNGAILSSKQYSDGVYSSFQEFLDNKPSITRMLAFPDPVKDDQLKIFELAQDSTKRELFNYWGICINDELYVVDKGILVPFEKNGSDFTLSAFVNPRDRRNHGRYRLLLGKKPVTPIHNTLSRCSLYDIPASKIDLKSGQLTF